MLYLIVTLLPSKEAAFYEAVDILEREIFTLRNYIVRPNIVYTIIKYERKEEDKEV
jgi:hypothetical protein